MKNNFILAILLILSAGFQSCKKDNTAPIEPSNVENYFSGNFLCEVYYMEKYGSDVTHSRLKMYDRVINVGFNSDGLWVDETLYDDVKITQMTGEKLYSEDFTDGDVARILDCFVPDDLSGVDISYLGVNDPNSGHDEDVIDHNGSFTTESITAIAETEFADMTGNYEVTKTVESSFEPIVVTIDTQYVSFSSHQLKIGSDLSSAYTIVRAKSHYFYEYSEIGFGTVLISSHDITIGENTIVVEDIFSTSSSGTVNTTYNCVKIP